MNAPLSEVDRLRARVAELEDELAEWRRQFGGEMGVRSMLATPADPHAEARALAPVHFAGAQWRGLMRLLQSAGTCVSKESLRLAVTPAGSDAEGSKLAETHVCCVRRILRLARAPGEIQTVWAQGYMITRADAAALRRWLGLADA